MADWSPPPRPCITRSVIHNSLISTLYRRPPPFIHIQENVSINSLLNPPSLSLPPSLAALSPSVSLSPSLVALSPSVCLSPFLPPSQPFFYPSLCLPPSQLSLSLSTFSFFLSISASPSLPGQGPSALPAVDDIARHGRLFPLLIVRHLDQAS